MIDFADIQSTAKAALEAHAYFSDVSVLLDDGTIDPDIERALGEDGSGVVVIVCLPYRATRVASGPGLGGLQVDVAIQIRMNPTQNEASAGAGKDMNELIRSAFEAILGWRPSSGPGKWVFEAAGTPLELAPAMQGEIAYDLNFEKLATFKGVTP